MSIKDGKKVPPKDCASDTSAPDQLQEQIDALVRGEVPKGSGSLRDLAKKPIPTREIRKKEPGEKSG